MSALAQIAASFLSTRPRDGKPTSGTSIDLRLTFHDGYGYIERITIAPTFPPGPSTTRRGWSTASDTSQGVASPWPANGA